MKQEHPIFFFLENYSRYKKNKIIQQIFKSLKVVFIRFMDIFYNEVQFLYKEFDSIS